MSKHKEELPASWKAGEAPQIHTNCDFVGNKGFEIMIHPEVFGAAFKLCEEVKVEWQILLTGSVVNNVVKVTGYYIPKQEVSASTVKNLEAIDREFIIENDVVGTMHSHANMDVFFSTVDDEYTNMSLIAHHVVINNNHKLVAKSRYDLPCGGVKFVDSSIKTMIPASQEVSGQDKIKKWEYKGHQGSNGFNTASAGPFLGSHRGYENDYEGGVYGYYDGEGLWRPWAKSVKPDYEKVDGVWKPVVKV